MIAIVYLVAAVGTYLVLMRDRDAVNDEFTAEHGYEYPRAIAAICAVMWPLFWPASLLVPDDDDDEGDR